MLPQLTAQTVLNSTCLSYTHTLGAHLTGEPMILVAKTSIVTFKAFTVLL